jgi:hypothetical protein
MEQSPTGRLPLSVFLFPTCDEYALGGLADVVPDLVVLGPFERNFEVLGGRLEGLLFNPHVWRSLAGGC